MAEPIDIADTKSGPLMFLAGGTEMGERIRAHDWSQTPLGPIATWPQSLRTAISLILNTQHPMWVGWGPDLPFFYNDAYISVLTLEKHPQALGQPAAKVWKEIWHICGPLADKVFQRGEPSYMKDVRLFMQRADRFEETFYSFSYSPIRDESGNVGGLFCPSAEATAIVLNTRRLRTLSELAAGSLIEKSARAVCVSAVSILAQNPDDIPFALLYLIENEGRSLHLEQSTGLATNETGVCQERVGLPGSPSEPPFWPFAKVLETAQEDVVSLKGRDGFPLGPAAQPVTEAVVLPVISRGQDRPLGVLICGINPTRPLDDDYRTFYGLVAGHIASAIQNARAVEADKKRADMLAELDRAKTTFFSNVSHELRTPLTLILGPLEDVLRESGGAREPLELAYRNSLRLLKLVNTLLDFSRLEAGRIEASFAPTDLAELTRELASVFRSGVERAGLRLNVDCPPLPEPAYVDREMWEKIVFNLLSNALKFTLKGEIEVKLGLTPPAPAGQSNLGLDGAAGPAACLSVRDTGTGIPAGELPRIFERFHRVRNPHARSHEGTGIGLALVQELARQHGGCVAVHSTEGVGTTFSVWIPLGKSHLPAERIGAQRHLAPTNYGSLPYTEEASRWLPENATGPVGFGFARDGGGTLELGGKSDYVFRGREGAPARILLADDNSDMRLYIRRMLEARGHDVVAVENGEAALKAIRAEPPELILSDVMMPGLDGFGLLREVRGDPQTQSIPFIMISARAGEESRTEGVEAGADDYLTKPFNARELLARVSTHLELSRIRRETAEKIRATLESITDGLHVVDASGRFIYLNAAARRMMSENGLAPEAMIGREYFELFPDNLHQPIGVAFRRCLHERVPQETENYYPPWQRWFNVRHFPRAEGGVSTFFQDITERKRAEAVILTAERRFRQLADTMPQMVWITKPDGAHEYFNKRWYEFTGMPDGTLGGPGWADLFHPDDDQRVRTHWKKTLAAGDLYEIEYRLKNRAGDYCWFLCRALPVRDEAGRVINWFGTCTDIEGFKRAEQALLDAKAAAESANRSKDRFLAALSHELRTPLTPVLMTASALAEDESVPPDMREQLMMIERNIALEARLIDDLLDISAIAAGKLHLHRQSCDPHPLIRQAVEMVKDSALTKEIRLNLELNATPSWLLADPVRFQQVVWNLLRNAVKFTPRGGKVSVRDREVTGADQQVWWRLEVTDSGIGIDPGLLEKIFQPFEQGAVTGDHLFGGLGLGLAIARAIVELHGGKIAAHSAGRNQGARFVVEFPAAPPGAREPVPRLAGRSISPNAVVKNRPAGKAGQLQKILLVEDHASTLQALSLLLKRSGYEISEATTVAEALALAAARKFDLVISDLGLPDGTGIQLMQTLRSSHGLRGIALTGYGMEEDIVRAREAGFISHLIKPVQIYELRTVLSALAGTND